MVSVLYKGYKGASFLCLLSAMWGDNEKAAICKMGAGFQLNWTILASRSQAFSFQNFEK